jgi:hypothetical protein
MLGATFAVAAQRADRTPAPVSILGSLSRVNAGMVSPWDYGMINADEMIAALGVGTVGKYQHTGEVISFLGRTFIRATTPKGAPTVFEVNTPLRSPFMVGIHAKPEVLPRVVRLSATEPRLLHTDLEKMANEAGAPIAVLGWADMPELEGNALKRAPSGDESLTGSKAGEYLDQLRLRNASVVFVAVVVPATLPRPSLNAATIAKMATDYDPSQGAPVAALIHVHGAVVEEAPPASYNSTPILQEALRRTTVQEVLHIYGSSTIQRGFAMVYEINYQE